MYSHSYNDDDETTVSSRKAKRKRRTNNKKEAYNMHCHTVYEVLNKYVYKL